MRAKIQETAKFKSLDNLQKKIYSSKHFVDRISHCVVVSKNRSVDYMIASQHPTATEYAIIKELLTS